MREESEEPGEQPDLAPDGRGADAEDFVRGCLGAHSSHPATMPYRLSLWRWLSLAAGSAVLAYSAIAVYRAFAWERSPLGGALSGLRKAFRSTDLILFVLALALAATLTAALTIRISRLGAVTSHRPFSRFIFGSSAVAMSAALLAQCVLLTWLITTTSVQWATANRWWIVVFAALPLEAILLYVEIKERRDSPSSLGWMWAVLRQLLFAAAVTAFAVVTVPSMTRSIGSSIARWLQSPTGILGWLLSVVPGSGALAGIGGKVMEKSIGGFISSVLGVGFAMIIVSWVTAKVSRVAAPDAGGKPGEGRHPTAAQRRGCLGSVLSMLNPFSWFRSSGEETEGHGEQGTIGAKAPKWARSLAGVLKDAVRGRVDVAFVPAVSPASGDSSQDFAPDSGDDSLEILFGGRSPTVDQVRAVELFEDLWTRHARSLHGVGYGPAPESHADLLIQAFPESFADPEDQGALEVQAAAAMIAVIARGQRVVFLVADEDERARVVTLVEARLASLRMETLYRVGSLSPSEMARWAPPAAAPGTAMEERPPDVLVAALSDYEKAFFGGASATHVMRALMFDAELVMVPNLLSLTRARDGRLHFPFIVDKHRLILASENRSMQLVIGTPPIGERPIAGREVDVGDADGTDPEVHIALEAIALRLFGGDAKLAGHSTVLRRRMGSFPGRVCVRVPASGLEEAVDAAALHAAKAEGPSRVCIVLGRESPRPGPDRLASLAVGTDRLAVLHELDFADTAELAGRVREFGVVAMQSPAGGRLVRDLGTRLDRNSALLIEVTSGQPAAAVVAPKWALTLPVFPSADSPALALAHLRSAAYQLGSDQCIRRDELVRFGIGWNRAHWQASGDFQVLHEGWAIELDGSASSGFSASADQGEVWPAAIVRSQVRKERPVPLGAPPERGLGLSGEEVLLVAEDGLAPDPDRGASWVGPRGQLLGTVDLAYTNRFVFGGERQDYRAVSAERSSEHGWIIHGRPLHGHADEPELPVVEVAVDVPASGLASMQQVRQGEHIRILSVRDRGGEERLLSTERISGLVSRTHRAASRQGAITAGDMTALGPIDYRLRVGMSFVCFGSSEWLRALVPPEAGAERLPDWIHGKWSVGRAQADGRTFSPAFTTALQQSLAAIAPGTLDFSRVAAFRVGTSRDGVVVTFIEPHATVGTVAEVMRTIMDDPALRRRFVGHMLESILAEETEELPGAPLFLVDMDEADFALDRDWAQRLITLVPGSVIDVGGPIGIITRDSEAVLEDRPKFVPAPVESGPSAEASHRRWMWRSEAGDVPLSVEVGILEADATAATTAYGCSPSERDPDRLRACGIRLFEGGFIGTDYGWMIQRSVAALEPLAERLLLVAGQAGATTVRDRVEVFASFVQSIRYVRDAQGRISDGKLRLGVQMPAETLFTGAGDCDSLSVLLLGLVRAAKLAAGCIVLVDEIDGGHALAGFELDVRSRKDWVVRGRSRGPDGGTRTFAVVETTGAGWKLGAVAPEYRGRYVRLDALG
jgi:hypothetical protein